MSFPYRFLNFATTKFCIYMILPFLMTNIWNISLTSYIMYYENIILSGYVPL